MLGLPGAGVAIIPQQETLGNYNLWNVNRQSDLDYTTTRNIRELQHHLQKFRIAPYYTTTRNIRELQHFGRR